jgi:uncharacterized protein
MELDEQKNDEYASVQSYKAGRLVVNHQPYHHSVILRGKTVSHWDVNAIHEISEQTILSLVESDCDLVLIGTGSSREIILPPAAMRALIASGVPYECMGTQSACHTWTLLAAEGRKVIAALIVEKEIP